MGIPPPAPRFSARGAAPSAAPDAVIPAIQIAALSKRKQERVLLSNIDLTIRGGCCTGLLGRNGAGKTSLLRCILNVFSTDAGQVQIFGVAHVQCRARRALAYMPEGFAPPSWLSGRAFLDMQARFYGVDRDAEQERQVLKVLDLDGAALRRKTGKYSKGMVQKLGLAACLLSRRQLLLLDEPAGGLDPIARRGLRRCLRDACAAGRTVLLSTHVLADIEQFCAQVVVLDAGRLCYADSPDSFCKSFAAPDLEAAYLACTAPLRRR